MIARALNPVVWASAAHAGRRLHAFALAEDGSRLDLLAAANLTTDPARAASYLRHAADEERHARMFGQAARERGADGAVRADLDGLFERLGEPLFLAFVHLGERRARLQFEAYRDWFVVREPRTAALFEEILADERRHEAYTRELLAGLVGEAAVERFLWRARGWEAWRAWLRSGRAIADALFLALVLPLYLALAPLAALSRSRVAPRSGWT